MKALVNNTHSANTFRGLEKTSEINLLGSLKAWIQNNEAAWEENRIGITAGGLLIQVTVASFMILILPIAGAPFWTIGLGLFLAFFSISTALAQCRVKWVLFFFLLSITVNLLMTILFVTQL